jgi:thioredoxin-like negative regulator of GroEL
MRMKIIHIVAEKEQANAFNKELHENSAKKCFILHFYMKGCYHCDNLEPKMKRLVDYMTKKSKYDNVTLGKINAEMMNEVNVENVHAFPTIKMMNRGQTHEYTGAPEEPEILKWIDSLLKRDTAGAVHTASHKRKNKTRKGKTRKAKGKPASRVKTHKATARKVKGKGKTRKTKGKGKSKGKGNGKK